jgi:plastocyanin
MRLHRLAGASLVAVFFAGCGGGDSYAPSSPSASPPPPATSATIMIVGRNGAQAFSPNPASFGGQMVVFRNNDSIPHRVVLNDGSVDTGDIAPGATSRAVAIPGSGTNYHCSLHPGMIGAVSSQAGPPPACTGIYCEGY